MSQVPAFVIIYDDPSEAERFITSAKDSKNVSDIHILDTGPEMKNKQKLLRRHGSILYHDVADDGFVHDAHNAAKEISDSEFYIIGDSDEEIVGDLSHMITCIRRHDDVGAVASPLIEPDRIFYGGANFREADGGLYREAPESPNLRFVDDILFAEFDHIPTTTIYRKSCVEDYGWDSRYKMGLVHEDFHLGHWKFTDWNFLQSFTPVFRHHTGGAESLKEKRQSRNEESKKLFLEKWGYDFWETRSPWMASNYEPRDDFQRAVRHYKEGGFTRLLSQALDKIL